MLIFFISFRSPDDPDMGWHLKDGEYLLNNHFAVAKTDIFSYTMPDFPLIMHEWVTDALMYLMYQNLGLLSLSVFFAAISSLAFIIAASATEAKKEYKIIAAILAVIASLPILGVRPQMLSLLALAIVIFIIFRFRKNQSGKSIFWLPLIFLFWVNLHGGFAVGLFFIGLFLALEFIKHAIYFISQKIKFWNIAKIAPLLKKGAIEVSHLYKLTGVFLVSSLVTLVNPYGWRVYVEIITTIFDDYTKKIISEWLPFAFSNPTGYQFVIYVTLIIILLIFWWRKIDYTYLIISAVFLYLAATSWRHMPLFLIVITPLWVNVVESISGSELLKIIRKKYFIILMLVSTFFIAKQQWQIVIPASHSMEILSRGRYPYQAVEYLKKNPIEGRMFNEYNWGGFLIWQYPEKKVFIDGRMPSWKINNRRAFEDFNKVSNGEEGWEKILEKYDVSFALVYNNGLNEAKFKYLNWEMVYADNLAVVYRESVRP
jgi:hypothetical protein